MRVAQVVFSFDRAAQLDLLLRSLWRFMARDECDVYVLYRCTCVACTGEDDGSVPCCSYDLVVARAQAARGAVRWYRERAGGSFAQTLARVLDDVDAACGDDSGALMFAVDDLVCVSSWSPMRTAQHLLANDTVLCVSLRLHPRVDACFMRGGVATPPPPLRMRTATPSAGDSDAREVMYEWPWLAARDDWGYAMSLDAHMYRWDDVRGLLRACCTGAQVVSSPNALEAALARAALTAFAASRPLAACASGPIVVNVPLNRVQTLFPRNRVCSAGLEPRALDAAFRAGRRLALEPLVRVRDTFRTVHVDVEMAFEDSFT